MRIGAIICLVIFVIAASLLLTQMWFVPFGAEMFSKVMISLVVLFFVVLGVTLVMREYVQDKDLKDKGFID